MSDVQIAVIDQQDTQIVLAVPGVQGATGSSIPAGGTAEQVLRKNSSTDYDANWSQVTSAMIADGTIVNADVNNGAAIAGTKISPDFGGQTVTTTGQVNAGRLNVTGNTIPSNGVYLPSANNVAISTSGAGRVLIDASGQVRAGAEFDSNRTSHRIQLSAADENILSLQQPVNTVGAKSSLGFWNRNSNNAAVAYAKINSELKQNNAGNHNGDLVFSTANAGAVDERLRITSDGKVGLGTSSPASLLDAQGDVSITGNENYLYLYSNYIVGGNARARIRAVGAGGGSGYGGDFRVSTRTSSNAWNTDAFVVDSSGRVGVGTTSPTQKFQITDGSLSNFYIAPGYGGGAGTTIGVGGGEYLAFNGAPFTTERMRIDSSGRLLVGTSSARSNYRNSIAPTIQLEETSDKGLCVFTNSNGASGPYIWLGKSRGTSIGSNTIVQDDDVLGSIRFNGADGSDVILAASIRSEVDGTPGANDMPGRLVFSTNPGSPATGPTERMRIKSDGALGVGPNNGAEIVTASATPGFYFRDGNGLQVAQSSAAVAYFNRQTSDGTLVSFRQDGTEEGTISVSGTTVSYNGAHLSRWSQLPSGAERTEILRGSVLSNIDEMCEWGDEENEQLNRMKVSDIEGDKNVSGVFQAWDDDDDTYTNDFYCAMTGDFIIRIGAGVTVERGDLLMSAGDGTAKPQDDDIIRSKTIAKVTSTNVSCTYDDGSYCVPCVLMAC